MIAFDFSIISQLPVNLSMLAYRGSVAHGMYTSVSVDPDSVDDIDLIGVYVASKEHYLGFGRKDCYEKWIGNYDIVLYELRKLMGLLLKNNPNVLSLLWLDSKYIKCEDSISKELIDNRSLFVSELAYNSFCGYAYGQLKGIEKSEYKGYMGCKRKELVDKFGYDCKHAAHLIRLLKMGIEFLIDGCLYVDRTVMGDSHELLNIKKGAYTLKQIKEWSSELFLQIDKAKGNSTLPDKPDKERVEKLLVSLVGKSLWVSKIKQL